MATCDNCGCETGTALQHADYPHEPGRLYDCPACEDHCHCTMGHAECIFEGEHNGLAEVDPEQAPCRECGGGYWQEYIGPPAGASHIPHEPSCSRNVAAQAAGTAKPFGVPDRDCRTCGGNGFAGRDCPDCPAVAANPDGNPYTQYTPEHRVWAKAQEHGKAAASWVFDGNTTQATYRRVLKGIRDGDPEVLDNLNPRSLRGGYQDRDLLADAKWVPHDGTVLRAELIEQYDSAITQAFWHEVERLARDQVEPVTEPGQLNDRMEFDHVVRVLDESRVTEPGGYAPELVMFTDDDGQALPDSDAELEEQAKSAGWRLLEGWTGQHGYSGPVMHPSEFVGGRLARHILETPGEYVVTEVSALAESDDGGDQEPAGWAIAFREVPEG